MSADGFMVNRRWHTTILVLTTSYTLFLPSISAVLCKHRLTVHERGHVAGYTGLDYQVAALLADKGDTLKITGAHNIDASQGLAAEIARSLNKDEATIVTLGYTPVSPLHLIVPD